MHHYDYHCQQPTQLYHSGLMGVFGGVMNLTTSVLYGGASIVRTIVEGSVWHAEYPQYHTCCQYSQHVCHVHCCPEQYSCCGCC